MAEHDELPTKIEKAFAFAQEAVKQMITLSTAIFTLTLAFLKDVAPAGTDTTLLELAWAGYLVSVVCGLFTLMNLAGQLQTASSPSIYAPGIKFFGILQALLFLAALGLTFGYGLCAT
jgi:hypothetical protein